LHYYNRFFSEPNHNFLDCPATRKLKDARSQMAAILATIIHCAIALPCALVVVDDVTNEMPAQEYVTKMAESYSFHTKQLSHIPGTFLFQEKCLK